MIYSDLDKLFMKFFVGKWSDVKFVFVSNDFSLVAATIIVIVYLGKIGLST